MNLEQAVIGSYGHLARQRCDIGSGRRRSGQLRGNFARGVGEVGSREREAGRARRFATDRNCASRENCNQTADIKTIEISVND